MTQEDLFPETIPTPVVKDDSVATCSHCNQTMSVENFNLNKSMKNNHDHRCKECLREYQIGLRQVRKTVQLRGVFSEKYCECCGVSENKRKIVLDHCKHTLKFRGWLCHTCNIAIGGLGDDIQSVRKALLYLYRSEEETYETSS